MDKRAEKQQRVESILLSLKRFDYLTRSQIQTIHRLKGDRNANRILNDMAEYLGTFRHGLENVYYLNKEGRDRVRSTVIRKKTPNIQHFLLRNQLWIHLKFPHTWENEVRLTAGDVSIIPDAKFVKNGILVFVEVDVAQPMVKNRAKIERYKKIRELTGDPFHVVWITEIESRRPALNELMSGLSGKVYTFNEIK
jgi:Replication-relaxation